MVVSGSDWRQLLDRTLKSLEAVEPLLGPGMTANVKVELDGLEVRGEQSFTRTASFSPAQMEYLSDLGVTVLVSAYSVESGGEQGARRGDLVLVHCVRRTRVGERVVGRIRALLLHA
jgi:hypothetical protein